MERIFIMTTWYWYYKWRRLNLESPWKKRGKRRFNKVKKITRSLGGTSSKNQNRNSTRCLYKYEIPDSSNLPTTETNLQIGFDVVVNFVDSCHRFELWGALGAFHHKQKRHQHKSFFLGGSFSFCLLSFFLAYLTHFPIQYKNYPFLQYKNI